ncbi:hypothetical protein EXN66_Car000037 [Channa argus]|uniref:Uncharacterized protein n=1 Tax=Channa argus TaxID=215402 RepID=A0A6G1QWK3_CHAAH|nr:hypothetical protein EXN66_Car000037 [Channa argus]
MSVREGKGIPAGCILYVLQFFSRRQCWVVGLVLSSFCRGSRGVFEPSWPQMW